MKRLRCPKCDELIIFDETRYEPGRVLIFECPQCLKQFRIRMPEEKKKRILGADEPVVYGKLIVLENDFQVKTEIPLFEGNNVIGRHVKGTNANAAFKTLDPSIDNTHCVVNVRIKKGDNQASFYVSDAPSNTGTFVLGELLADKEKRPIFDGDIINIGAATMILEVNA